MLLIINKERLQAIKVIIYNCLSIITLKVLLSISKKDIKPKTTLAKASKFISILKTLTHILAISLEIKKESYNMLFKYIKTSKGLFKN
jgi:hypothetical protein